MGLFFLISAYLVPGASEHKGPAQYVKERLVRLGTPIAVLLVGGFVYAFARTSPCMANRQLYGTTLNPAGPQPAATRPAT